LWDGRPQHFLPLLSFNRTFDGDGFAAGHTLATDQELLKFS